MRARAAVSLTNRTAKAIGLAGAQVKVQCGIDVGDGGRFHRALGGVNAAEHIAGERRLVIDGQGSRVGNERREPVQPVLDVPGCQQRLVDGRLKRLVGHAGDLRIADAAAGQLEPLLGSARERFRSGRRARQPEAGR